MVCLSRTDDTVKTSLINIVDRKLRTASIDSLKLFLSTRSPLPKTEALKLWKGLYYAMWMADRPAPQQRLAAELAALAESLPNASCRPVWFAAFWDVLGQQWSSIDKLRMDKFLLLVRRVLACQLRFAIAGEAELESGLKEWPFEEEGDLRRVPLGLRLHIMDIWIDELEREGGLGEEQKAFAERVGKMVQALRWSPIKQVRERARESYDDERLPWAGKKDEDENVEEDGDEWGGLDD